MLRLLILIVPLLTACSASDRPAKPPNLCEDAGARCVNAPVRDVVAVDGDTFELQRLDGRVRLRLIGWDSPETGDSASCAAEDALGQQVEERASVDGAPLARDFSWSFAGWPLAGICSACRGGLQTPRAIMRSAR